MKRQVSDKQTGSVTNYENGFYLVNSGSNSIIVDPNSGGRVISFNKNGFEFLTDKTIHPDNYGSTFWPSPQSYWNWPPPVVLDSSPYSTEEKNGSFIMKSRIDPVTGFQFTKMFSAGQNECLKLTYGITNKADYAIKAAGWEVTRMKKGGLLFFPIGEKQMRGKQFETAKYSIIDEILWYKDELVRPESHKLNIADGLEGWIAYAINSRLYIKRFFDVTPEMQAPGEAEILFYVSPEADYIEVEVQGKYQSIEPSAEYVWETEWNAVVIPQFIDIFDGSNELLEFARRVVLSQ